MDSKSKPLAFITATTTNRTQREVRKRPSCPLQSMALQLWRGVLAAVEGHNGVDQS